MGVCHRCGMEMPPGVRHFMKPDKTLAHHDAGACIEALKKALEEERLRKQQLCDLADADIERLKAEQEEMLAEAKRLHEIVAEAKRKNEVLEQKLAARKPAYSKPLSPPSDLDIARTRADLWKRNFYRLADAVCPGRYLGVSVERLAEMARELKTSAPSEKKRRLRERITELESAVERQKTAHDGYVQSATDYRKRTEAERETLLKENTGLREENAALENTARVLESGLARYKSDCETNEVRNALIRNQRDRAESALKQARPLLEGVASLRADEKGWGYLAGLPAKAQKLLSELV